MHITYAMVRDDLPRIIAVKGEDYQYDVPFGGTCLYVDKGAPSCLIGHYLIDLGFPMEAFESYEGRGIESLFHEEDGKEFMASHGFTADPEAVYAMGKVQDLQDNRYSWGQAYESVFEPDIDE